MKKFFILIFVLSVLVLVACKSNEDEPHWDQAHEIVSGVVSSEEGQPLQGIQIVKYLDEELQQICLISDEVYSNAEGKYYIDDFSRSTTGDPTEFYLVVTDTTGMYQPQTIKAQMTYTYYPVQKQAVGGVEVNIIMHK